jgi:hypothetical protein
VTDVAEVPNPGRIVSLGHDGRRREAAKPGRARGTSFANPVFRTQSPREAQAMDEAVMRHAQNDARIPPTGEELAERLFGLVVAGVLAVIVLMVVMGEWWAA